MSRIRIVGGKIIKTTGGNYNMYAKDNIVTNSAKAIREVGVENGIIYGDPKSPQKQEIIKSIYKFESTYIHDHLLSVVKETIPKFNTDDTSIIYRFYKAIIDGKITNRHIEVSANLISGKAFYDLEEKKIIVWETSLLGIEKNNEKK